MKKNRIIIALLLTLVAIVAILSQGQAWILSINEACTLDDGLYEQSLLAPWPNNAYETATDNYRIGQFYKYKNRLYYPLTIQAKWRSQLLEPRDKKFFFYSYDCQTAQHDRIDEDGWYLETKILQTDSGNILIRHDDVNEPYEVWLHINEDGSIEQRESATP